MTAGIERTVVLEAAHGQALRLKAGRSVRLVNPYGVQAVDVWAFVDGDLTEYLSMEHVRSVNSTVSASTTTSLVSNRRRPLVTLVEDTSAGRHDTLLCPCSRELYQQLGADNHRSCTDNLHEALAGLGLSVPFTPASLNLFMAVDVRADGSIDRLLPSSAPNSHVVIRADVDVVLAFSSCPQDITLINGPERTPRACRIEVLAAVSEASP